MVRYHLALPLLFCLGLVPSARGLDCVDGINLLASFPPLKIASQPVNTANLATWVSRHPEGHVQNYAQLLADHLVHIPFEGNEDLSLPAFEAQSAMGPLRTDRILSLKEGVYRSAHTALKADADAGRTPTVVLVTGQGSSERWVAAVTLIEIMKRDPELYQKIKVYDLGTTSGPALQELLSSPNIVTIDDSAYSGLQLSTAVAYPLVAAGYKNSITFAVHGGTAKGVDLVNTGFWLRGMDDLPTLRVVAQVKYPSPKVILDNYLAGLPPEARVQAEKDIQEYFNINEVASFAYGDQKVAADGASTLLTAGREGAGVLSQGAIIGQAPVKFIPDFLPPYKQYRWELLPQRRP